MATIKIGGEDREYRLFYRDVFKFDARFKAVGRLIKDYQAQGKTYNLDKFIFWCVWKSLTKRGVWPFRKPFRSMAHMIKRLEADEYQGCCDFVASAVLPKPKDGEAEKKNQGKP